MNAPFSLIVLLWIVKPLFSATPFLNSYLDETSRQYLQKVFNDAANTKVCVQIINYKNKIKNCFLWVTALDSPVTKGLELFIKGVHVLRRVWYFHSSTCM